MSFSEAIRNTFINNMADAISKGVNGSDLTKRINEELSKQLGPEESKKLEEGLVADLLLEAVEGCFAGDPAGLEKKAQQWLDKLTAPKK